MNELSATKPKSTPEPNRKQDEQTKIVYKEETHRENVKHPDGSFQENEELKRTKCTAINAGRPSQTALERAIVMSMDLAESQAHRDLLESELQSARRTIEVLREEVAELKAEKQAVQDALEKSLEANRDENKRGKGNVPANEERRRWFGRGKKQQPKRTEPETRDDQASDSMSLTSSTTSNPKSSIVSEKPKSGWKNCNSSCSAVIQRV